jgi:hypothetical protein
MSSAIDLEIRMFDTAFGQTNKPLFDRLIMFRVYLLKGRFKKKNLNKLYTLNFNWNFQIWLKKHLIVRNPT